MQQAGGPLSVPSNCGSMYVRSHIENVDELGRSMVI